jgi:hypothetical protein
MEMPYRTEQAGYVTVVQKREKKRQVENLARLNENFEMMQPEFAEMLLQMSDVYATRYPRSMGAGPV